MELDLMRRHAYVISPASLFNEDLRTWANAVTLVRTVGGLVLFSVAAFKHSAAWNLAGLAVYWGLDVLDGYLARALNQETRFGVQMDILADRFLVGEAKNPSSERGLAAVLSCGTTTLGVSPSQGITPII